VKSYGTFVVDRSSGDPNDASSTPTTPKPASLKAALTRPVIIAVLNYALAALVDISMFAIFSVYLAVPILSGGLNLPPEKVGIANAGLGFLVGMFQATLFPTLVRSLGPKKLLMTAIPCSLLAFLAFPMVHIWVKYTTPPEENGSSKWLWVGIILILIPWTLFEAGGGTIFLFITAACPSPNLLGTVNGASQTLVSFTRAVGPAAANSLFAFSVKQNLLGGYAVFLILSFVTMVSWYSASLLPTEMASNLSPG